MTVSFIIVTLYLRHKINTRMSDHCTLFKFSIENDILKKKKKNEIIYCSNIRRIIKDIVTHSIETFVFYEICEFNPQLSYYQFEFCKCFLNFAKEYNR